MTVLDKQHKAAMVRMVEYINDLNADCEACEYSDTGELWNALIMTQGTMQRIIDASEVDELDS